MNAEALLAHYERIAEAPDAIARLRRFVLNLAVRGKLVPQDASEAPVRLGREREEHALAALPISWRVSRLADLIREDTRNGYSRRPDDAVDGVPLLRISAGTLRQDGVVAEEEHKLISGIDARTRDECGLQRGDLLACRFNGNKAFVGRLTIYTDYLGLKPIFPDKLIRVRANTQLAVPGFLRAASESDLVRTDVEAHCATTVGNWGISASNLKEVRFPVPPLAEQHRIVAKVDELMALCDRLEAARTAREATRDRLAAASLARLNTPDPETFPADARFALDALAALTTRSDQIKHLRQTILNLAVRGKLVPQDARDEPASTLLRRLRVAQAGALAREGIRARPPVERMGRNALWFTFPASWECTFFDDLFVIVSGVTKGQRVPVDDAVDVPYLRVANVQRGFLDLTVMKTLTVRKAEKDRYALRAGDLLMTEGGDWDKLGRTAVWRGEITGCIHQNHVFRVRPPSHEVCPEWVAIYTNSEMGRTYFEDASKQTTNLASINMTQLRGCPLPLPPLAEQHRIVAKVNELMALCDALEASVAAATTARTRLLEATLAEALVPATAQELEAAE